MTESDAQEIKKQNSQIIERLGTLNAILDAFGQLGMKWYATQARLAVITEADIVARAEKDKIDLKPVVDRVADSFSPSEEGVEIKDESESPGDLKLREFMGDEDYFKLKGMTKK